MTPPDHYGSHGTFGPLYMHGVPQCIDKSQTGGQCKRYGRYPIDGVKVCGTHYRMRKMVKEVRAIK